MKIEFDYRHHAITQGRIIKSGFNDFIRNASLAVAAISVITITLTIILFTLVANITFSHTIDKLNSKVTRSVYLVDTVTEDQRVKMTNDLKGLSSVQSVTYVSKEEALKKYLEAKNDDPATASAFSLVNNPLPASLLVKPKNPNNLKEIDAYIAKPENKDLQVKQSADVNARKDSIKEITKATHFIQQAGVIGVLVFAAVSILIIFNTIRMTVFNRRDELGIMRLLGATRWFIRGPFVVETVIYGIIAASFSMIACWAIFRVASVAFGESSLSLLDLTYANQYFHSNLWWLILLQLMLGIGVGIFSSILATRRYLKLKR